MSDIATIEARIAAIFASVLHLDIASMEMDIFETGAVDSLGFVELLLQLEREFGVKVLLDDLELDRFRTIRRIGQFVMSHNGHAPAGASTERADPVR